MAYEIQVKKEHYFKRNYLSQDRWMNFWYQLETALSTGAKKILEVGAGNQIVAETLRKLGISVTTADIDPELSPDVVASVVKMPFLDNSFDLVLAAEVLEHLPWDKTRDAIREIHRVSSRYAVITLPHAGYTFACIWKMPLIHWQRWFFKIPHFWKIHKFNGEHYWELGKKGFSIARIKKVFRESGFSIKKASRFPDDPAHYFFLLEKL